MKNLLILIVAAALFLHFYPQPELEKWYSDQKNSILSGFNDATNTRVKLNPKKVFHDIEPLFNQFSQEEIEYVTILTSERDSIISFFSTHCKQKEPDFNFQSKNQISVCNKISQYQNFF